MTQKFMDIQKVVEGWAWTKYDDGPTRKQKTLREKQKRKNQPYIGVKIDWSECEFHDETIWSPIADDDTTTTGDNKGASPMKAATTTQNDVNILFNTEFTNETKSHQTYTLRVEKTTKSSASTEVENGITKGFELGVALKMPSEVLEMNAGYSREVSLTNTSGETFEEELHWGADSEIRVDPESIAHASLVVKEKKQTGDFEIVTKIKGYVGVTFTNLRDNNSFLKRADGNISFVVNKYLTKQQELGRVFPYIEVNDDDEIVTIRTKGSCKFRFGIKQEVKVNQTAIK